MNTLTRMVLIPFLLLGFGFSAPIFVWLFFTGDFIKALVALLIAIVCCSSLLGYLKSLTLHRFVSVKLIYSSACLGFFWGFLGEYPDYVSVQLVEITLPVVSVFVLVKLSKIAITISREVRGLKFKFP